MTPDQRECDSCSNVRLVVVRRGDFALAERCTCLPPGACCVDGYETKIDENGYSLSIPCRACTEPEQRRKHFNAARIPGHYFDATLVGFEPVDSLRRVRERVYRFAHEFQAGDSGLLFYGEPGRGKTHLMVGILRYLLLHRRIRAHYVEFMHLLTDLRASYDKGSPAAVMAPLIEVPVLAVDELGKGRSARQSGNKGAAPIVSEWVGDVLDELISKRYNAGRTTLFATNFYPTRGDDPTTPTLKERVGERIYSRLAEMCEPMHIAGDDYRLKLAKRRL